MLRSGITRDLVMSDNCDLLVTEKSFRIWNTKLLYRSILFPKLQNKST